MLHSSEFQRRHRSKDTYFTRHTGPLTFAAILLAILHGFSHSLQGSLDSFFQRWENNPSLWSRISKSAFCQARRKIAAAAFEELNTALLSWVDQERPLRLGHGLRLLALDATTYRLPRSPDLFELFPPPGMDKNPLALSSTLFDVLNGFILHTFLHASDCGERALALAHAAHWRRADLLLFDRGYFGFWFFAWLRQRGVKYCTRATGSTWKPIVAFARSRRAWAVVTLRPSPEAVAQCRRYGLPLVPMRVRLIRVLTAAGTEEILLTSLLDRRRFPERLFPDLYHLRWGIEGCFRDLKWRFQIENFSGRSPLAVQQDFRATVLAFNLKAVFTHTAQAQLDAERSAPEAEFLPGPQRGRPRNRPVPLAYRVNHSYAVSVLQDALTPLLRPSESGDDLDSLIPSLLATLMKNREAVRPQRSFPRKRVVRDRPIFNRNCMPSR